MRFVPKLAFVLCLAVTGATAASPSSTSNRVSSSDTSTSTHSSSTTSGDHKSDVSTSTSRSTSSHSIGGVIGTMFMQRAVARPTLPSHLLGAASGALRRGLRRADAALQLPVTRADVSPGTYREEAAALSGFNGRGRLW